MLKFSSGTRNSRKKSRLGFRFLPVHATWSRSSALHVESETSTPGSDSDLIQSTSYIELIAHHELLIGTCPRCRRHGRRAVIRLTLEVARWREERRRGWRLEGKLGPRSRKLICFLCPPAVPERQTTHCPYERGFKVRWSSAATVTSITIISHFVLV